MFIPNVRLTGIQYASTTHKDVVAKYPDIDPLYFRYPSDRRYADRVVPWRTSNDAWSTNIQIHTDPSAATHNDLLLDVFLPAEFRYITRSDADKIANGRLWLRKYAFKARDERSFRKKFSYLVPFERPEIPYSRFDCLSALYVGILSHSEDLEVPEWFYIFLHPYRSKKSSSSSKPIRRSFGYYSTLNGPHQWQPNGHGRCTAHTVYFTSLRQSWILLIVYGRTFICRLVELSPKMS